MVLLWWKAAASPGRLASSCTVDEAGGLGPWDYAPVYSWLSPLP